MFSGIDGAHIGGKFKIAQAHRETHAKNRYFRVWCALFHLKSVLLRFFSNDCLSSIVSWRNLFRFRFLAVPRPDYVKGGRLNFPLLFE
jgi:hypothetical protein